MAFFGNFMVKLYFPMDNCSQTCLLPKRFVAKTVCWQLIGGSNCIAKRFVGNTSVRLSDCPTEPTHVSTQPIMP